MDTNALILELIKTLVWPVTIVLVIVLLRPSLLELVPALRRLRYRDFELEFERKLERLSAQADEAQLPRAKPAKSLAQAAIADGASVPDLIEQIAITSPRAGVAEAWRLARAAVHQRGEGLSPPIAALVTELRVLRDQVVHNTVDVTPGQALQYAALAQRVIDAIEHTEARQGRQRREGGS